MKCVICKQGETHNGTTTVTLEQNSTTLVFKEVPAQVCSNCLETYIEEEIAHQLLTVAKQSVDAGVQVDVREFKTSVRA